MSDTGVLMLIPGAFGSLETAKPPATRASGTSSDRRGQGGRQSAAAKLVSERASSLVRLELQLAAAELKQKVVALGLGIVLLFVAAVFGVFAVGFGLAAAAAALATTVSTWLALLIVTGALLLLAGLLGAIGVSRLRKGTPLIPVQAIEEAKLTTEALKNGRH
jgi:protein-S-isoprenylcysteine O-methyltransferase Ste14